MSRNHRFHIRTTQVKMSPLTSTLGSSPSAIMWQLALAQWWTRNWIKKPKKKRVLLCFTGLLTIGGCQKTDVARCFCWINSSKFTVVNFFSPGSDPRKGIQRYQQGIRDRAATRIEGGDIIRVEAHPIPEHPRPWRVEDRAILVGDAAGYVPWR